MKAATVKVVRPAMLLEMPISHVPSRVMAMARKALPCNERSKCSHSSTISRIDATRMKTVWPEKMSGPTAMRASRKLGFCSSG